VSDTANPKRSIAADSVSMALPYADFSGGADHPYLLSPGQSLLLDWGRKRTGWLSFAGRGVLDYAAVSDLRLLDYCDQTAVRQNSFAAETFFASFVGPSPCGMIRLSSSLAMLDDTIFTFRYLRLRNTSCEPAVLEAVDFRSSEFPEEPVGFFECSDTTISRGWRMGIDTVRLCTQPGDQSNIPVYAPFGGGYVQWDGCRRDREVWGGDLRPGALAWYYNFADQSPIANSLYLLMNAQHIHCSRHGLFPGSASSHQTFYEWAFWEVVALWEYIQHTGDPKMIRFAAHSIPAFLEWCEREFGESPDGWIHADLSWMYTLKFLAQALPSLQASAALALKAMASMFDYLGGGDYARRARVLHHNIAARFQGSFWSAELNLYRFAYLENENAVHSDLCTNCWAILADLAPPSQIPALLQTLRQQHCTERGSLNLYPLLHNDSPHDNSIWPFANAYEVTARFHAGDVPGALELFQRYIRAHSEIGCDTLSEMFHADGRIPLMSNGNLLSFCHAWGAQASWALQRYLLGIYPLAVGWSRFAVHPLISPLKWVRGKVNTPLGLIEVELETTSRGMKGKVTYPSALQAAADFVPPDAIELRQK